MKKIITLSLVLLLLFSGVCFAEKSKLKKNTWTPVQTRTDNSVEVQDFYNHKEVYHEGDKQVGLWFVTFIPNQKGAAHSYFYEAVVLDYAKLSVLTRQIRRIKKSRHRISVLWMRNGKALPGQSMKRCITE